MPAEAAAGERAMVEVEWARLKAHELRAAAQRGTVVIVPTAAIEQHGPHLPVMTDTRLGHEIAVRAARMATDRGRPTLVTPVLWAGLSEHHMPFGGTITLDYDAFFLVLKGVAQSLVRHGFTEILISNSHGGNIIAVQAAADRLATELGATIVATTYVREGADAIGALLEDQPHIMHACEGETAMMMAVEPDLVDTSDLASLATPRGKGALAAGKASFRWRPFTSVTANGVSGNPARATAAKGEKLLDVSARALADLICDAESWVAAPDLRGASTGGVPFADKQ